MSIGPVTWDSFRRVLPQRREAISLEATSVPHLLLSVPGFAG
jgi:hypothetical protein